MRIKKKTKVFILFFLIAFLFAIALPAVAQQSGQEILTRTSENITEIEEWWDALWESTFVAPTIDSDNLENASGNLSLYTLVNPVRFILAIALTFWIFNYGKKITESKGGLPAMQTTWELLLPVLLAMLFLTNQAEYSRLLAYGLRGVINSWSNEVLEITILDVNVRSAVQDMLITEDSKEEISRQLEFCQALPQPDVGVPSPTRPAVPAGTSIPVPSSPDGSGQDTGDLPLPPPVIGDGEELPVPSLPLAASERQVAAVPLTTEQRQVYDYLECLDELASYVEERLQEAENERTCNNALCETYRKFLDITFLAITDQYVQRSLERADSETPEEVQEIDDSVREDRENFGILATKPGNAILYFTQWMSVSGLEMALYLNGLFAPLFIAVSLVPNRQNLFAVWLIETMTIGLAKVAYNVIVGIVAVQQVSSVNVNVASDNTFFLTLGIFAPAVAFAVVTIGGLAAASSYRNQAVGTIGAIGNVVTGAFASLSSTITRNADKNR